jgi:hypothetical protein
MRVLGPAVVIAALASMAAQSSHHRVPRLPYEDAGACPFECCLYREWSVRADTLVRSRRDDAAPIAFRVARGAKVVGVTGVVITTKLGLVAVRRPTTVGERKMRVAPGEPLHVLHYVGEGYWKFWLRGQVDQDQLTVKGDRCIGGPCDVEVVEKPVTVWWAKIRDTHGREGWTRDLSHFGGIDGCG